MQVHDEFWKFRQVHPLWIPDSCTFVFCWGVERVLGIGQKGGEMYVSVRGFEWAGGEGNPVLQTSCVCLSILDFRCSL